MSMEAGGRNPDGGPSHGVNLEAHMGRSGGVKVGLTVRFTSRRETRVGILSLVTGAEVPFPLPSATSAQQRVDVEM
jgi:hypothetical protein